MVDSRYQGGSGQGGTHNAIMSSEDYLSQAQKNLDNLADDYYIAPAFLDKVWAHTALAGPVLQQRRMAGLQARHTPQQLCCHPHAGAIAGRPTKARAQRGVAATLPLMPSMHSGLAALHTMQP